MKLDAKALTAMKGKSPIAMLTAYNCPVARNLERSGIPVLLVGDSLAMVERGLKNTRSVTIEHMQYHVDAVRRGAPNTHIIGDLPYQTYETKEAALRNSRLLIDAGADSVKLEGSFPEIIAFLVSNEIDVVGHTGLTPQTADNFRQVGKDAEDAQRILREAEEITAAGAFLLVLEHIPSQLGEEVTRSVTIPTVGIGAGPACDGQVLVINDMLGIGDYLPPFSKQYADVGQIVEQAAAEFRTEVENRSFLSRKG
jgi:3-methyl-2-oxobutanoate hydroxymethyltransferase